MSGFLTQEDFERIFKSHLKTETYSKSVESLFTLRSTSKTDYKPYYQRNYVWDDHKATYFIESILLGTEIPPLIFFNNGFGAEVIDGRQRYETIKRFKDNEFSLTKKGLAALKQIEKETYESLRMNPETKNIIDLFLDAKIRIIEFEIVNEPKLDTILEDKVKKEIFARYNSGITPLKKQQIDNAVYDGDRVYQHFKNLVKRDREFSSKITDIFSSNKGNNKILEDEKILQFVRKYLVLHKFPIRYYSWGNKRTETLDRLYEQMVNEIQDIDHLSSRFIQKVNLVHQVKQKLSEKNVDVKRSICECLLWIFQVLDAEELDFSKVDNFALIEHLSCAILENKDALSDSSKYGEIQERFSFIAQFFEDEFDINLRAYVDGHKKTSQELNFVRKSKNNDDTVTKLGELESLRVTKPEPSRCSIDDISIMMDRNMFLVRPSYQRKEVITVSKASSIIESILLDISLPPIFIFKRLDGVSEVVDGQQRLLTILGFIGKDYMDENGFQCASKNSGFSLRGLKILKKLNNKSYKDFKNSDPLLQDKILDFQLLVVEIQEKLNPSFNPVDLFVRLNNKPYPIKENSFEMWNSWVDRDIVGGIKNTSEKYREWFYIKSFKSRKYRDRMENEELLTSLSYLEYQRMNGKNIDEYLYIYNTSNGINVRISSSRLTKLFQNVFEDEVAKNNFLKSIKVIDSFIKKVKLILLDRDIKEPQELDEFLGDELNFLFKAKRQIRSFVRTKKDFYLLFYLLNPLNRAIVTNKRIKIKQDLQNIFHELKNIPENFTKELFLSKVQQFHAKYSIESRKTTLSQVEKIKMLKEQDNQCGISGAPLFIGDELEVDHIIPIGIGGEDSKDNLQITHKYSNRQKGSKPSSQ